MTFNSRKKEEEEMKRFSSFPFPYKWRLSWLSKGKKTFSLYLQQCH
jgi:hypothetical protein